MEEEPGQTDLSVGTVKECSIRNSKQLVEPSTDRDTHFFSFRLQIKERCRVIEVMRLCVCGVSLRV